MDLSGSMSRSYVSKYKKINEDFVSRILGEQTYNELKKKLGAEKVINNHTVIQTLLNEG